MEFKSVADLRSIADVTPAMSLTRAQKISLWIAALDRDPMRVLQPLPEIEWIAPAQRAGLRLENSPLSIAFGEPSLRAAGLSSDRLGDALAFFDMTEAEAHDALCSCRYGRMMTADAVSRRLAKLKRSNLFANLRHWIVQKWNDRPVMG